MILRVIRWRDCRVMPWANGGGETVEIAVSPEGASFTEFDWRISSALVASPGPFSLLPGIERTLCLTSGDVLDLEVDGQRVRLDRASPPFRFSGEATVSANLPGEAVRDLNIMTRRGRAEHSVEVIELTEPLALAPARLVALCLASGRAEVTDESGPVLMESGDTVLAEDAALNVTPAQDTHAPVRLILIRLSATPESAADGVESAFRQPGFVQ